MIGGQIRQNLSEEQIEALYRTGAVDLRTSCREVGEEKWLTLGECMPLLKYVPIKLLPGSEALDTASAPAVAGEASSGPEEVAEPESDSPRKLLVLALKTGWTCLGVGLALA